MCIDFMFSFLVSDYFIILKMKFSPQFKILFKYILCVFKCKALRKCWSHFKLQTNSYKYFTTLLFKGEHVKFKYTHTHKT